MFAWLRRIFRRQPRTPPYSSLIPLDVVNALILKGYLTMDPLIRMAILYALDAYGRQAFGEQPMVHLYDTPVALPNYAAPPLPHHGVDPQTGDLWWKAAIFSPNRSGVPYIRVCITSEGAIVIRPDPPIQQVQPQTTITITTVWKQTGPLQG